MSEEYTAPAEMLATRPDRLFWRDYALNAVLTSQASGVLMPGAPLSSLMIDPATGKYYSEMRSEERPDARWIREFVEDHIGEL